MFEFTMDWSPTEIIVATITATATVIVAYISRKKDEPETQRRPEAPRPSVEDEKPKLTAAARPRPERKPIAEVTHREIVEKLAVLTPYHRDIVEKSYHGTRVRWRVILHSVGGTGDRVHLFGDVADTKAAIECNGTEKEFLALMHAADHEEIEVEGTIDLVSSAFVILNDCETRRLSAVQSSK